MKAKFDKSLASAVALALLVGLAGGFFLWGRSKKAVDIKQLLRQALHEVELQENELRQTAEELRKLKEGSKALADIAEENRVLKEDLLIAQQDKRQLEQHLIQLKEEYDPVTPGGTLAGTAPDGEQPRVDLQGLLLSAIEKHAAVQASLRSLRTDLKPNGKKKPSIDAFRERIAGLDREHDALRSILESIRDSLPDQSPAPPGEGATLAPPPQ